MEPHSPASKIDARCIDEQAGRAMEMVREFTGAVLTGCAIDLTALKIVSGKRCWVLQLDGLVLSDDGNLLDALSIATKVSCKPSAAEI